MDDDVASVTARCVINLKVSLNVRYYCRQFCNFCATCSIVYLVVLSEFAAHFVMLHLCCQFGEAVFFVSLHFVYLDVFPDRKS